MNTRRLFIGIGIVLLLFGGWASYIRLLPLVEFYAPTEEETRVSPFQVVEIRFSRPMNMENVIEHVTITPNVEWAYRWETDRVEIFPANEWPRGTEIQIEIAAGAKSALGLGIQQDIRWSFTTMPTLLAYLWPSDSDAAIYVLDITSGDSWRISEHEKVLAFDVDRGGNRVYYSTRNEQGGADLYGLNRWDETTDLLFDCGEEICSDPQIAFDNRSLAFTRTNPSGLEIWVMNVESLTARRVSLAGHSTRLPDWSRQGVLSYYDISQQAYILVNKSGEPIVALENQTGEQYAWSPSGEELVAPEFFAVTSDTLRGPSGEADNQPFDPQNAEAVQVAASQLFAYPLSGASPGDLTRSDDIQDFSPSFSPNGAWLAFARKYVDEERWTIGRQIWIVTSEGSNSRQLTDAPNYNHTSFAWHPDRDIIATVRFNNVVFTDPPEIWVVRIDSDEVTRLVIGGYSPQWIP